MNGGLLLAILFFCSENGGTPCIKLVFDCIASGQVYEMSERKATKVVAGCIANGKTPTLQNR